MHTVACVFVVGVIYALGRKEYGRLGLGEDCDDAKELIPIPALKEKKCVDISCGDSVSFAVTDRGEYEDWDKPDIKPFKTRHCFKCYFRIIQYIPTINKGSYICEKDISHTLLN